MRSGHARLLPNQDVLAFVMEAFIEHGLADETITMFNEMRAKVCYEMVFVVFFNLQLSLDILFALVFGILLSSL